MKHISKILIIILLSIVTNSYGQTDGCTMIYNSPETMPHYKNDFKGLLDYLTNELVPIIADCIKRDIETIDSLHIILTIDRNGNVIDATFPKYNLTSRCKDDLKRKLLTMNGWTAGQKNGQPVCSKFKWVIVCLKWNR